MSAPAPAPVSPSTTDDCRLSMLRIKVCASGRPARASPRKPVQVLQVQERQYLVIQSQSEVLGHIVPALADIDACQFQPCQQGYRADLVLRIRLDHTPDLLVVGLQRQLVHTQVNRKQRQVPPVVGDHEGVQPGPGRAAVLHELQTLLEPTLGQHHMGQGVLGPGFALRHGQGRARGGLCLRHPMALLPGERRHAVHLRHVRCGGQCRQRQAQHAGRIAPIETVVLAQLD